MNKRSNRVYWLLFIMLLILGLSIIIDCIRKDKKDIEVINNEVTTNDESSTEPSSEATTETTTRERTTVDPELVKEFAPNYYNGLVFIGDSIIDGFARYASTKEAPQWLNNIIFLTKVSWRINTALEDSNGPMYKGQAQNICTSLSQIKPERVFLDIGINDMNGLGSPGYSVEKLVNSYVELIKGIKNASPESKIYIVSVTPGTEAMQSGNFSNEKIKEFNDAIKSKASELNFTFLDLASEFDYNLDSQYSSDNKVHHNNKSYSEFWVPFLEKIAVENLW